MTGFITYMVRTRRNAPNPPSYELVGRNSHRTSGSWHRLALTPESFHLRGYTYQCLLCSKLRIKYNTYLKTIINLLLVNINNIFNEK